MVHRDAPGCDFPHSRLRGRLRGQEKPGRQVRRPRERRATGEKGPLRRRRFPGIHTTVRKITVVAHVSA